MSEATISLQKYLKQHTTLFLAALLGLSKKDSQQAQLTFQTFDDTIHNRHPRLKPHILHGSLTQHADSLERLNLDGAGIFITVNEADGKGRKKANIVAIRGWHADLDTKNETEPFDLKRVPLRPSMVVQTPGGMHLYWLAKEPMPCGDASRREEHETELRGIQNALAVFGADPAVCDVSRVLRVPGFMHCKKEPRLVQLVKVDGPRYTREQIREAFPPVVRTKKQIVDAAPMLHPPMDENRLSEVISYLNEIEPAIQGERGSTIVFTAAMKCRTSLGLSLDDTLGVLWSHYNSRCIPPWTEDERKDFEHHVRDGWEKAAVDCENCPRVPGFEWDERGLYHVKQMQEQDENGNHVHKRVWIAPPFTLPGLVRDGVSYGWRLLIAWHDPDGIPHEEGVPFELLSGEGAELARVLGQGGLVLSPEPGLRRLLLRYLSSAANKISARVRLVDTLGWHEGAFVLPGGEIVGEAQEPVRFAGETHGAGLTAIHGTLDAWKEKVASLAVGNPRLVFSIAAAFAGPLLELVRPDGGGGFNLMGSSSKGKTTCLEVAASVWGRPDPLITWRATGNGLEGIAATRNDSFLPLDELSQVDSKEAGQVAYLLSNGSAKARMTKEGGNRPLKQWRLIFLSSGEQSLEDKVNEDGRRVRAGQEVRVPDVPCPTDGMFEDAHGMPNFGEFAEHLKSEARQNYGHAIRVFLQCLCKKRSDGGAFVSKLREMETAWMTKAVPAHADGQVRRVAGRFALVSVAGELACEMGILPWPAGEASCAVLVCFQAWLDRRGHIGASERERGLQAVVDFILQHGLSRCAPWNDSDAKPANMAGVRKKVERKGIPCKYGGLAQAQAEGWDFYLTPTGWKEACRGFDAKAVAHDAMEEGLLEPARDGKPYRKERTPNGQGRWYVIRAKALGEFRSEGAA